MTSNLKHLLNNIVYKMYQAALPSLSKTYSFQIALYRICGRNTNINAYRNKCVLLAQRYSY